MNNVHSEKYIIISVIGPHAGESEKEIFVRKIKEIENTGKSFWLHKSYNAKPDTVQNFCKVALRKKNTPLCIFIQASSKGGAQETKNDNSANEFSIDKIHWEKIPQGILVTGSVKNAFAMVFDKLEVIEKNQIDLRDYSLYGFPGKAVKIVQGSSTICCIKESSKNAPDRLISNIRKIAAIGRLVYPFEVWLR